MFSIVELHNHNLNDIKSTFKSRKTVFFHKQISLFSHSLKFIFFCLFYSISFSINFRDASEDGSKIASSDMLHFMELIHSGKIFLWCCIVAIGLIASKFMIGPVSFLTLLSTVVDIFTSSTTQKLFICLLASLTLLLFHL